MMSARLRSVLAMLAIALSVGAAVGVAQIVSATGLPRSASLLGSTVVIGLLASWLIARRLRAPEMVAIQWLASAPLAYAVWKCAARQLEVGPGRSVSLAVEYRLDWMVGGLWRAPLLVIFAWSLTSVVLALVWWGLARTSILRAVVPALATLVVAASLAIAAHQALFAWTNGPTSWRVTSLLGAVVALVAMLFGARQLRIARRAQRARPAVVRAGGRAELDDGTLATMPSRGKEGETISVQIEVPRPTERFRDGEPSALVIGSGTPSEVAAAAGHRAMAHLAMALAVAAIAIAPLLRAIVERRPH